METILKMNYGQHMLFSYSCIALEGESGRPLTIDQLHDLSDNIMGLTDESNYGSIDECPDVMIMTQPQDSYGIFCDFWEENKNYLLESE